MVETKELLFEDNTFTKKTNKYRMLKIQQKPVTLNSFPEICKKTKIQLKLFLFFQW